MDSTQHRLDRVRQPPVQLTYDVEIGGTAQTYELSFVMGILADLAGKPAKPLPPLKNRKFIDIDQKNINDIMASLKVQLPLRVKNVMGGKGTYLNVLLSFHSMEDFNPANIVGQIDVLREEYEKRISLMDLLSKLEGNDGLDTELKNIIENPDVLKQLQHELENSRSS